MRGSSGSASSSPSGSVCERGKVDREIAGRGGGKTGGKGVREWSGRRDSRRKQEDQV